MIQAYGTLGPVVLQYRALEFRQKYLSGVLTADVTDADWDKLDRRYAKPTVENLAKLQGMYCK